MLARYETTIRPRYHETDAQGHVHHATYLQYFELGRVEQLRAAGIEYADMERDGTYLVVSDVSCRYYQPCRFGDTLRLVIDTVSARGARIRHTYRLYRGEELLAEGSTTIGCVNGQGSVRRLPAWLASSRGEDALIENLEKPATPS
jgi:acyl-CoA thioester hydrolase